MRTLSIAAAVAVALSPLASSAQAQDRYAPVDLSGIRHPEPEDTVWLMPIH